jgi:hypothetical protein
MDEGIQEPLEISREQKRKSIELILKFMLIESIIIGPFVAGVLYVFVEMELWLSLLIGFAITASTLLGRHFIKRNFIAKDVLPETTSASQSEQL